MAREFICNGCGKREPAVYTGMVIERNGIAIHVHMIKKGQVYFQKWPKDVENQNMFANLFRMPIQSFKSQIRQ